VTVPSSTARTSYNGNGVTTAFSTGFYFLDDEDVLVVRKPSGGSDTIQTLGVHYTLVKPSPGSGAAGTVNMLVAPAAGDQLFIQRNTPFHQDTSFRTQGDFSPAVHEDAMDKLEFQIQELDVRLADVESAGAPGAVVAGDGLVSSGTSPMALHVGAGSGIVVATDTVSVIYGDVTRVVDVTKAAASAGIREEVARIDHKHNVATAAPGALTVNGAAAEGVAATLARSDHTHTITRGAPVQLDATASSPGASGNFSDADHKHDIKSGAGVDITDSTNTAGTGPGFALEGHSHSHGNRGGGSLHAAAVAGGASGFMTGAQAAQLATITDTTLTTTDATVTTIATATPTNTKAETIIATVTAKDKATGNSASYRVVACAKRQGGTTTLTGVVSVQWSIEDVAGWDATIDVSTPDVRVRVTGAAATNIDWKCRLERIASP
jgi:hypothetical protein